MAAIELVNKRLDWIEESLGRVVGLQYTAMGRAPNRPDETEVPPEIQELVQQGKTKEAIKRYRQLTGADMEQAQSAIEKL
jgi:ribosomal protein L7/L12